MSAAIEYRAAPEFAAAMRDVARELLGEPNKSLSSRDELRFGSRGSLSIVPSKGIWHDHETDEGGGTLDLVMRETRTDKAGALTWLRERGHLEDPVKPAKRQEVACYDYRDEAGVLRFQVVRFAPKDFRQRQPDGTGGWIWKMSGVERVLYRLQEITRAVAAGRTVYIAEGEKSVEAVAKLGLAATCSPMGANKWRAEYGAPLAGADVVILPDNDDVGRSHAQMVAKALAGLATRVRVLELPGLAQAQDVADWIERGGTATELEWLTSSARDAEEWARTPEPQPDEPAPAGRTFGRLRVLSVEDALDAPARSYILDGLLAPGELSVFWGKPKCGKSFLMLRLAYGLAQGVGFWSREAVQVPVLYVAAEGQSGINGRIRALRSTMGPAPSFHLIAQAVDLFDPKADLSALIEAASALKVGLVVLDTLARVMTGGDESATRDMNVFVANCDAIREQSGAHVAVVHHGGWDASHARGSTALVGAADIVIKVRADEAGGRAAEVEYAKDDATPLPLGFELSMFELPPDAKGRPRATCVATEAEALPAVGMVRGRMNEEAVTLLREIHDAIASGAGFVASPQPEMAEFPCIQRSVLVRFLVRRGWLRLNEFPNEFGNSVSSSFQCDERTETVPKAEHTRLWKRLNTLKTKGFIGTTQEIIWLPVKR